jgi:hypothetical protein
MWWNDISIIIIQGAPLDASMSLCETLNIKTNQIFRCCGLIQIKQKLWYLPTIQKKGS